MGVTSRRARRARGPDVGPPAEVIVEVDRLVFDGLGPLDRDGVGRAVEAELAARLASITASDWGTGASVDRVGPLVARLPALITDRAMAHSLAAAVGPALARLDRGTVTSEPHFPRRPNGGNGSIR